LTRCHKCQFEWSFIKLPDPWNQNKEELIKAGVVRSLNVKPGSSGILNIGVPEYISDADILKIKSIDPYGNELYTNTWVLKDPETFSKELFMNLANKS